jgi:transcriptional regulator with XRE-family HTH domain
MATAKSKKAPAEFVRFLQKAIDEHPDKPSLREVARRSNLSVAYLSYLLNGDRDVPSNAAIRELERALNIPQGELNKAAGRPDDKALEFFRKDKAAPIMRTLAKVPANQLETVRELIEKFISSPRTKRK